MNRTEELGRGGEEKVPEVPAIEGRRRVISTVRDWKRLFHLVQSDSKCHIFEVEADI